MVNTRPPAILMNWMRTLQGHNHSAGRILAGIWLLLLASRLVAQFVPGGGGVPGRPADSFSSSTNRLDLDGDSRFDFAVIENVETTYTAGFGGWIPRTATSITLVPLEMSEILVADAPNVIAGELPALLKGEEIGPIVSGAHWAGGARGLVTRVDPGGLVGPLAPLLIGAPGRVYCGVRVGQPQSHSFFRYGWLGFSREGGAAFPISWGISKMPGVPVSTGDPDSIPPLQLNIALSRQSDSLVLTWSPPVGDVKIEEGIVGSATGWQELPFTIYPGFARQGVRVEAGSSAPFGVPRVFRIRIPP